MSDFFLKEYFAGIPHININFIKPSCIGGADGIFRLSMADNYRESDDELYGGVGYRSKYIELDNGIGFEAKGMPSWADVLNHPGTEILISTDIRNTRLLVGTLLHELLHYYCWYLGYGHGDSCEDFNRIAKEMEIPLNTDHIFEGGKWEDSFDYSKMDRYIGAYKEFRKSKGVK